MIGHEEIRKAACDLSNGGLKLYLYLCENVDGYDFWLSPKDVIGKYNMSKSTYDRAKAELKQKGYLEITGNNVYFYANPEDNKINKQYTTEELKKRIDLLISQLSVIDDSAYDKYCDKISCLKEQMKNEEKKHTIMLQIVKELENELKEALNI